MSCLAEHKEREIYANIQIMRMQNYHHYATGKSGSEMQNMNNIQNAFKYLKHSKHRQVNFEREDCLQMATRQEIFS